MWEEEEEEEQGPINHLEVSCPSPGALPPFFVPFSANVRVHVYVPWQKKPPWALQMEELT